MGQINLVDPDEVMKMADPDTNTTRVQTIIPPWDDVAEAMMTTKDDKENTGVDSLINQEVNKDDNKEVEEIPKGIPTIEQLKNISSETSDLLKCTDSPGPLLDAKAIRGD